MYRIEGDGTKNNTKIWCDGELIDWGFCSIYINEHYCNAYVDCKKGHLDRVVLIGVYKLIGDGDFTNTRIFAGDELLRGVRSVTVRINKSHPTLSIETVFLPNLIEGDSNGV